MPTICRVVSLDFFRVCIIITIRMNIWERAGRSSPENSLDLRLLFRLEADGAGCEGSFYPPPEL